MSNIDLLEDACARLPHTTRKMFGGHGLFAPNGGMFAGIVDDDQMILKFARGTKEAAEFAEVGGAPWVYHGKQGDMTMSEWLVVPEELYDNLAELAGWAAKAHRIAPAKAAKAAKKDKAGAGAAKEKAGRDKATGSPAKPKPAAKKPAARTAA